MSIRIIMLRKPRRVNSIVSHPVATIVGGRQFHSTQILQQSKTITRAEYRDPEWDSAQPYNKIPGPTVFQLVKNFAPGGRYHNANLADMYRLFRQDHGDLVRMPGIFGRRDLIMSFRPDDYEKIFRTEGQWPLRRGLDTFEHFRKHVRPDVFKGIGGLVTEQGENWQTFRSTVNPVMMMPKTIKQYINKMDAIACDFIKIMKETRDEKNELPSDFRQELNRWALESMGVLALDTRLGILDDVPPADAQVLMKNLQDFFELIYQLDVLPSMWRYYKTPTFKRLMSVLDALTDMVKSKIDETVARLERCPTVDNETQSVLEKLLKMNRDVAIIMALDMMMAGVDTTSSGVIGILYCLARNPDKQAKLREELRTVLPRKDSQLTTDNMKNLPYLRACIKESIRLCPPVSANMRGAGHDIVLQGYQIPKQTDVAMTSMILQTDERFIPRAKEFLPERWLKQDGYPSAQDVHPFLYLPFGFGVRTCIGRRLAQLEMEVIIARITRMFEYRWHYGELKVRASLVNVPINELKFQMTEVED